MIVPRPYQAEALNALDLHMRTKDNNPCVVIPTGGGKSILMAWAIQQWKKSYPPFRVIICAHRQELVEQNSAELIELCPNWDIGIYSSGLKRYDLDNDIIYAGIDSVFRRWGEFPPFDVIIVDECFVENTQISMANGTCLPIQNVKVGDYILNAIGVGRVTSTFKKQVNEIYELELTNGKKIECTGNHPIFTVSGWKKACDLEQWERILCVQDMPGLWSDVHSVDQKGFGRKHNKQMQGEDVCEAEVLQHILLEESGKPNVQCEFQKKSKQYLEKDRTQTESERWKWNWTDKMSENVIGYYKQCRHWMGAGNCDSNKNEKGKRLSNVLQSGCRAQKEENLYRSGRSNSLFFTSSAGHKERKSLGSVRLASIKNKKQGSGRIVYNLEVDGHPSYFANEALAHNCQRIPPSGEGKYRKFVNGCKSVNDNIRIVGLTATPYRMGCGPICHKDHILNEICYEANVGDLIDDGYLCKLRSHIGDVQPDMKDVRRNSGGDYIVKSLAEKIDTPELVQKTVKSAMQYINAEKRKSIMFFCVDIKHCKDVSMELRRYGIDAPMVTGKTSKHERKRIAKSFKNGYIRAICNVNVYTEGFNAKRVDCIVLLRPTLSKGLFSQMVGRGLRLHPDKTYCRVLDYAHCIDEHGPIDCLDGGEVTVVTCERCGDSFSRAVRQCPNCEWEIPKQKMEEMERQESEKRMHEAEASNRSILSSEPETFPVDGVNVARHRKQGKPDSLRVQYRCGITTFKEWICLEHGDFAERIARKWWADRFGTEEADNITVDLALQDMFLNDQIMAVTDKITVRRRGKHTQIIGYELKKVEHDNNKHN